MDAVVLIDFPARLVKGIHTIPRKGLECLSIRNKIAVWTGELKKTTRYGQVTMT